MSLEELKAGSEGEICAHCKGLISIRLPVPSSGCDHLYYPAYCAHCRSKQKSFDFEAELALRDKRIEELKEKEQQLFQSWQRDVKKCSELFAQISELKKENEAFREYIQGWAEFSNCEQVAKSLLAKFPEKK